MNSPPGGSVASSGCHDEILDAVDEGERDDEADEQGDDGVGDALAQLVEVLEEGHPPFEVVVLVVGWIEPPSYFAERRLVLVRRRLLERNEGHGRC